MSTPDPDLVGLAPRAGREPARVSPRAAHPDTARSRRPERVVFRHPMNVSTILDTDLVTPLGAYLHLRETGARRVPARVRRAGPARPLLARRLRQPRSSASRRRRRSPSRSSATSATTTSPMLEPTVPLPDAGAGCPRAGSWSPTCSCASTTPCRWPRCSRGDPADVTALLGGLDAASTAGVRRLAAARFAACPRDATTRLGVAALQGAHPRGRRLPDRALAARRAPHRRLGALRLPGAAAREPVAVPVPARARRRRARRLVARDAREARGHARVGEPDRRLDQAGRRRRRAAARAPRRTAPST